MIPDSLRAREAEAARRASAIAGRRAAPHGRCGWCDELIEPGEPTLYLDDERCHRECVEEHEFSVGIRQLLGDGEGSEG